MANGSDIDDNFDRALQAFLSGRLKRTAIGCPHPGLLSARGEGKLADEEAEEVDRHLLSCSACREQLATLAGFVAAPATERVDDRALHVVSAEAPYEPLPASIPLGRSTRANGSVARAVITGSLAAIAAASISQLIPSVMSTAHVADRLGDSRTAADRASTSTALEAPLAEEPPPSRRLAAASNDRPAASGRRHRESAAKADAPAPVAIARRAAATSVGKRSTSPERMDSPASAPAVLSEAASDVVAIARSREDVRWRIGPSTIDRSDDQGRTWRPQQTSTRSILLAASAPSDIVCWVAGKNGAVLRTVDGQTWKTVMPPTSEDLVRVSAWSAVSATVRTARGERFSTVDGGASWSRL